MPTIARFYGIKISIYQIRKWITIHKDELIEMWKTQQFRQLPPLE